MDTSSLSRFGPPLGHVCLSLGLAALLSAAPPASHGAGFDLRPGNCRRWSWPMPACGRTSPSEAD